MTAVKTTYPHHGSGIRPCAAMASQSNDMGLPLEAPTHSGGPESGSADYTRVAPAVAVRCQPAGEGRTAAISQAEAARGNRRSRRARCRASGLRVGETESGRHGPGKMPTAGG